MFFEDVDLCLKAARARYKIIRSAGVKAEHCEPLSRGKDMDGSRRGRFFHGHQIMLRRWSRELSGGAFSNKNLLTRRDVQRPAKSASPTLAAARLGGPHPQP
jgi:GT2 family glycosyltransferase